MRFFVKSDSHIPSKLLDLRYIATDGQEPSVLQWQEDSAQPLSQFAKTVDQLLQHIVIILLAFNYRQFSYKYPASGYSLLI